MKHFSKKIDFLPAGNGQHLSRAITRSISQNETAPSRSSKPVRSWTSFLAWSWTKTQPLHRPSPTGWFIFERARPCTPSARPATDSFDTQSDCPTSPISPPQPACSPTRSQFMERQEPGPTIHACRQPAASRIAGYGPPSGPGHSRDGWVRGGCRGTGCAGPRDDPQFNAGVGGSSIATAVTNWMRP